MGDWPTRSFWLERGAYVPGPALDSDETADVVIVGGGFTGLWSAIHLKEADPGSDVVILEQEVIGYGASGRNGGFATTWMERNLSQLLRRVGKERGQALHRAMAETLRGLEGFVRKEGIRADLARTGLLSVSNGPEQDVRIRKNLEAAEELGLSGYRPLDAAGCRELLDSERLRCGHWEDDALLVDPAALARGLKQAALRRGVRIFEGTHVENIEARKRSRVEARTPRGTLRADRALIATNAWAGAVPGLRRYLFTLYAYIILTEPLSQEQWRRVGWERRMGVGDMRIMRHFHRPTPDGRILWGGRDAPFSPRGPDPARDRNSAIFQRLEETFRWTFPQLDDVRIERGWGGPVCGTVSSMATIGWLRGERILYALGYAGHGVGPSKLAGEIVCNLMLGRDSDLTRLPMVTRRPTPLPPEPLRSLALRAGQRILQKVDDSGGAGGGPLARIALKLLE